MRLRYQCSPYHHDSALYPFVQQFERAADIAPQENPEAKLDKLETVLGLATHRMNEVAPLIASMLSPRTAMAPPRPSQPLRARTNWARARQTFVRASRPITGSGQVTMCTAT